MFREIIKKSSIYSLVPIITRGTSFCLLPIYTRVLTPSDYGVMELLDLTTNVVGLILGTRVGQALFYFYYAAKTEKERNTCVSTLYLVSMMMGALCVGTMPASGLFSTIVFGNPSYAGYLKLVFAAFAVSVVGELNLCYLRARGYAGRYVMATLISLILNVASNLVLLLVLHMGVRGTLIASLVSAGIVGVWLAWSGIRQVGVHIDWTLLWRVFKYSVPISVGSLAMFVVHYGDRLFLRSHVTLADIGVYSLAYKFAMVVSTCHLPFILHWNAQVGKVLAQPEGDSTYSRSCTYLASGMVLVGVTICLFIRPLITVMVAPSFYGAASLVPLLVAAYVIRAVGAQLQSVFIAEGRPGLDARVTGVGATVCVLAYAVLIPSLKVWGAIIATLLGFVTILLYGTYLAQRLRHFELEYVRMLRVATAGCLCVGGFYTLPRMQFWQGICIALLCWIGYVGWFIQWGLTVSERRSAIDLCRDGVRKVSEWRLAQAA
jgi:O-antigen/teichoic acid export membrane protein